MKQILFTRLYCDPDADPDGESHYRQFHFQMSGHLKVAVSDGEEREFIAGNPVVLEDTSGKGHLTQSLGDVEVNCAFMQLPATGNR